MKKKILVIDDEESIRLSLKEGLQDLGYEVYTAVDGHQGLTEAREMEPNLVLLDIRLPRGNGMEILQQIKGIDRDIAVIMITAYGETKEAVKAIKNGAFDYVEKPFDFNDLSLTIKKALEAQEMKRELCYLRSQQKKFMKDKNIIGNSPAMKEVMHKIDILAENDVTVLIRGETGVGKELVAREIHSRSRRAGKPFLDINCGAIPGDLLESELFGFEKSAFTGAVTGKKGLLEIADGGTVFLDEIGELPVDIQVKLLRFLEDRRFKRIGGLKDVKVDVRILAATNKNLEKAIEENKFREDLFYRLNVVPVYVPPLRERGEDVKLLAEFFLAYFSETLGKEKGTFSQEVLKAFMKYNWPGNVRELRNVIERLVIFNTGGGEITIEQLPAEFLSLPEKPAANEKRQSERDTGLPVNLSLEREIERLEKQYIKRALIEARGNKTKAAEILGISRFALLRRLEKYGNRF
ncbi:MAG: sigma-54-dependent Fis family transcriptional regulator [Firmicutes bacterium]|nr:sigma-54-dependent Fis family transcriptional regulator [Bacillota bacterium]